MAANNQIVVIGRAGNDVSTESRKTQQGTTIAEVRLAVNRTTKDSQGNPITDWISCKFWDKQADRLAEFVKKGDLISVTGSLRVDNWDSPQGEKRQKYYVNGENFQMLTSKQERQDSTPSKYPAPAQRKPKQEQQFDDFEDDDLPPF
jgi:single-strand DNA-binding protein